MCVLVENQAFFLHKFTGLGSRFIACQKTLEGGKTDEEEKISFNQKQIFHKILFSPWPDSPSHIPDSYSETGSPSTPHAHTDCKT